MRAVIEKVEVALSSKLKKYKTVSPKAGKQRELRRLRPFVLANSTKRFAVVVSS